MQTFSKLNGSLPSPPKKHNDLPLINHIESTIFSSLPLAFLRRFSLSFAAYYNLISEGMKNSKATSKEKRTKSKLKKIKRKVLLDTEIQMDAAESSQERGPAYRSLMLRKGEAV